MLLEVKTCVRCEGTLYLYSVSIVILEMIISYARELTEVMVTGLQQVDTSVLGLSPEEAKKMPYIASMGIYVFRKDILLKLLR